MKDLKKTTCLASFVFALLLGAGPAWATDLFGHYTGTVTITEDSRLVDDVTCDVPLALTGANACIAFGADHIKLSLDGHTISGPLANPPTGCSLTTDTKFGVGILVDSRSHVTIEGPGVIQRFQRWGIELLSSHKVTVRNVTVNRNCWSGMQVTGTTDSRFESSQWINNAGGSNGAGCGGICLTNSNKNRLRKSTFYGNGSVDYEGPPPVSTNGNVDFGVGFEGSSSENLVEDNDIGGNTNGVFFFNNSSDNVVRRNIIAGNPAAQVIKTFTAANQQGADIAFRPNFFGANNVIEDNFCLTYIQGAGPATAPCPNINTPGVEESANRLTNRIGNQPHSSVWKTSEYEAGIFSVVVLLLATVFKRPALG